MGCRHSDCIRVFPFLSQYCIMSLSEFFEATCYVTYFITEVSDILKINLD